MIYGNHTFASIEVLIFIISAGPDVYFEEIFLSSISPPPPQKKETKQNSQNFVKDISDVLGVTTDAIMKDN